MSSHIRQAMQPLAVRRMKRTGCSPRRSAPLLLFVLFVVYGAWFTSMLNAQHNLGVDAGEASTGHAMAQADDTAAAKDRSVAESTAVGERAPRGQDGDHTAPLVADDARRRQPLAGGFTCNFTSGPPAQGHSATFQFEGDGVRLRPFDGHTVDNDALTVGAWVYLDNAAQSIQSVMSNKASGCGPNAAHFGFSIFLNEWQTSNQQPWLSWGNLRSGCEELGGEEKSVPFTTWTHLGATFAPHGDGRHMTATLFVNGHAVASTANRRFGVHKIAEEPSTRFLQGTNELYVGIHPDRTHPFYGGIEEIALWHEVLGAGTMLDMVSACAPLALQRPSLVLYENFDKEVPLLSGDGKAVKRISSALLVNKHLGSVHNTRDPAAPPRPAVQLHKSGVTVTRTVRPPPTAEERKASDDLALARREAVKRGFKHAWDGYRKYAWGTDELKPKSNQSKNWLHQAATMVDSLDCLWIMGFKDDFYDARDWIAQNLHYDRIGSGVSVFETIIRSLGGLLSAYDLSQERIFLTKAQELADVLLAAFKTPTGLPCTSLNFKTGACAFPSWTGKAAILSEFGTIQLEFKYLTQHTGDPKYAAAAMKVMSILRQAKSTHGLFPTYLNANTGKFTNGAITFGALGDSYYEYLVKQWIQTGKREDWLREMYDDAMEGMIDYLVYKSSPGEFVYVADYNGRAFQHKMDHLVCFVGAMLAIGSRDSRPTDETHMAVGEAVTDTCFEMYRRQPTGLSPEYIQFAKGKDMQVPNNAKYNILRPEAVESLFVLHYYTKHPRYRDMGWDIFQAFEKWCRTPAGYASVPNVLDTTHKQDDKMESFFLAETMKYMYLLFDPTEPIPLERYVFNTEAHPLTIFDSPRNEVLGVHYGIH